jgi:cytochrome c oxidase cbb3-type subunit I
MTDAPAPSSCCSESAAVATTAEIDASCRLPLFTLFGGAAFWLLLSSVFGLIASLTFHSPKLFADCAYSSYGRAYPIWSNLLLFGFCVPAGLGVGLWLLARLGRAPVSRPWLAVVGGKLWNVGVLTGFIAILTGNSTGFEWLEMPHYAAAILFVGFTLIALCAFATHSAREKTELYPSQWFVLAALFCFPWIYSTSVLLLDVFPVRGIVQASIAWWFSGNLFNVWLPLAGLASTFYILPKMTGRPLHSHYTALFAFWTIILFGTWTGIPAHAALPAWMPTLSSGAKLMMLIPALTIAATTILTCRGGSKPAGGGPLCFTKFGVSSLVLSMLLLVTISCPRVNRVTDYTWFGHGQTAFTVYSFFLMTMLGAVYHILPQLVGEKRVCPRWIKANFWLVSLGSLLFALPLLIGGVSQGLKLVNASVPFVDVAKSTLMAFRISTTGEALILVGNLVFLCNIGLAIFGYYRSIAKTAYADATAQLEPAGVKS